MPNSKKLKKIALKYHRELPEEPMINNHGWEGIDTRKILLFLHLSPKLQEWLSDPNGLYDKQFVLEMLSDLQIVSQEIYEDVEKSLAQFGTEATLYIPK